MSAGPTYVCVEVCKGGKHNLASQVHLAGAGVLAGAAGWVQRRHLAAAHHNVHRRQIVDVYTQAGAAARYARCAALDAPRGHVSIGQHVVIPAGHRHAARSCHCAPLPPLPLPLPPLPPPALRYPAARCSLQGAITPATGNRTEPG